ncbi:MAG: hypothetical protein ABI639_15350 [Thermoanaerobaculia bacterium]
MRENPGRRWLQAVSAAVLLMGSGGLVPLAANAQDGYPDPTFSGDGYVGLGFPNPPTDDDWLDAITAQPDGKILIAGRTCAGSVGGECTMMVVRLLPGGNLDPRFSGDGMIPLSFGFFPNADDQRPARILHLTPSGKTLVVGLVTDTHGRDRVGLLRLNVNGSLDSTFGGNGTGAVVHFIPGGGGVLKVMAAVAAQGYIYVGGYGTLTGYLDQDYFIARFTADGLLDSTYAGGVGVRWIVFDQGQENDDKLADLAVQSDGKVVAVGQISDSTAGDHDTGFVRLTQTGFLDGSFNGGAAVGNGKVIWQRNDFLLTESDIPVSVAIQPDGRILFSGSDSVVGQVSDSVWYFGRLLKNGASDPQLSYRAVDFGPGSDFGAQLLMQSDGKIVLSGESGATINGGAPWCSAARFVDDGASVTLDPTFGAGGLQGIAPPLWTFFCKQAVVSGGRLIIGGYGALGGGDRDLFVMRWTGALVFNDGLASGSTGAWSAASP